MKMSPIEKQEQMLDRKQKINEYKDLVVWILWVVFICVVAGGIIGCIIGALPPNASKGARIGVQVGVMLAIGACISAVIYNLFKHDAKLEDEEASI